MKSDDILSEYGRGTSQPQVAPATSGGVTRAKELPYDPPTGRAGSHMGPGLGGDNHGNSGTQGCD